MKTIRTAITMITVAALSACGGGGDSGSNPVPATPVSKDVTLVSNLVTSTPLVYVRDLPANLHNEPPMDGVWAIASRHQGANPMPVKQNANGTFTSTLNTANFPFAAVVGGGPHNALQVVFDKASRPKAFGDALKLSWKQSIDSFAGTGVAQVTAIMYLENPETNEIMATVIGLYDNRAATYDAFIAHDTFTYFSSAPIGDSKYISSKNTMTKDTTALTDYEAVMTKDHMSKVLADLNAKCSCVKGTDPAKWTVYAALMLHEISTFNDPTVAVNSTVTFSALKVEQVNK